MTLKLIGEVGPWLIACETCSTLGMVVEGAAEAYLLGTPLPCQQCGGRIGFWPGLIEGIVERFRFGALLSLAGCTTLAFGLQVPAGHTVEVNLVEHGVPEDAEVILMNLTGAGGVTPLVVHGNDVIKDPFAARFFVYGRPSPGPVPAPELYNVSALVTWFHRKKDDTVIRHLVDAVRQYHAERFDSVIVPANIAAEASLSPVIFRFFKRYGGTEHVKDMLKKGATYSHQLNVLVPMMATVLGLPPLPDQVRGILNRLRGLRNDLAHEGACKEQGRNRTGIDA